MVLDASSNTVISRFPRNAAEIAPMLASVFWPLYELRLILPPQPITNNVGLSVFKVCWFGL